MSQDTPNPCPFCGSDSDLNKIEKTFNTVHYYASCTNCECEATGPACEDRQKALDAWNYLYSPSADQVTKSLADINAKLDRILGGELVLDIEEAQQPQQRFEVGQKVHYQGQTWVVRELCEQASLKAGATIIWARVADLKGVE